MDDAVQAYLDGLTPARRRRNANAMLALMGRVTGLEPRMWGTCVGYGSYRASRNAWVVETRSRRAIDCRDR